MKYVNGIGKFLKDYFGPLSLAGAAVTAGAVGCTVFTIVTIANAPKEVAYVMNGGNVIDSIFSLYQQASNATGEWIMPAGAAGQLLTYKFKRSVASLFEKNKRR